MTQNNIKFNELRKKYPTFVYDNFNVNVIDNNVVVTFCFRCGNHVFTPTSTIFFNKKINLIILYSKHKLLIDNIVFNIGMIELISYWKATCSPLIKVKCGFLSKEQLIWWKSLYFNGLGEFFFVNNIQTNENEFVSIASTPNSIMLKSTTALFTNGYIIPIGGGKDSIVTIELLKRLENKIVPLIINPREATIKTAEVAGFSKDDIIIIHREIDMHLLKLNSQGYLNGHTPFSAMLAFYSLLVSAFLEIKNIALSNEQSANEPTVLGSNINHQYSKSIDFEIDFRNYYTHFISPDFNYFSFLRPLSELQIVKLFSQYTAYHKIFRSCNVGSKENKWCCNCPKCLFTFIMLSKFLSINTVIDIFGDNLLEKSELQLTMEELCGLHKTKPFECVGSVNEVKSAVFQIANSNEKMPLLIKEIFAKLNRTDLYVDNMDIRGIQNFLSQCEQDILFNALNI